MESSRILSTIERYRLDILSARGTVEEAQAFVQELLVTDWEQLIRREGKQCSLCGGYVANSHFTFLPDGRPCCRSCYLRYMASHDETCEKCNSVFTSSYWNKKCGRCMVEERKERRKVQNHMERAKALHLPATLTSEQWFLTLNNFQRMCAYCLVRPYVHCDHFIPLCKNGGTTQNNCVPACNYCNKLKHRLHPDDVIAIPREVVERVRVYLSQFSTT